MADILDPKILGPLRNIKKEGFFEKLVNLFEEDSARIVALIKEVVEAGDSERLAEVAHSLKSASSSVGAVCVSDLAYQLEKLGSQGTVAGAAEILPNLEKEITAAQEALKSYL